MLSNWTELGEIGLHYFAISSGITLYDLSRLDLEKRLFLCIHILRGMSRGFILFASDINAMKY